MFSYRHGFHAGNHADVLKHTVLMLVLRVLMLVLIVGFHTLHLTLLGRIST